jgi:DNA gyrase subunit B/topoisomerase-4 subunit B
MKSLPPKLDDCREHTQSSELFIVEGDSAARSVSAIRSKSLQAVLPMQGKPMNAMKATRQHILDHPKYADVLAALGIDTKPATENSAEGFQVDLDAIRYERIILLFDPDADGIHARTLMHLFFYRWLRPLLDAGRVLDAHPPLWQLTSDQLVEPMYAFTKPHYDRVRQAIQAQDIDPKTTRYRGLGNIPGPILRQMCLDPSSRKTTAVTAAHAEVALEVFAQMRQYGNRP